MTKSSSPLHLMSNSRTFKTCGQHSHNFAMSKVHLLPASFLFCRHCIEKVSKTNFITKLSRHSFLNAGWLCSLSNFAKQAKPNKKPNK